MMSFYSKNFVYSVFVINSHVFFSDEVKSKVDVYNNYKNYALSSAFCSGYQQTTIQTKNLKRRFDLMNMFQKFGKSAIFNQHGGKFKAPLFFLMQFFIIHIFKTVVLVVFFTYQKFDS